MIFYLTLNFQRYLHIPLEQHGEMLRIWRTPFHSNDETPVRNENTFSQRYIAVGLGDLTSELYVRVNKKRPTNSSPNVLDYRNFPVFPNIKTKHKWDKQMRGAAHPNANWICRFQHRQSSLLPVFHGLVANGNRTEKSHNRSLYYSRPLVQFPLKPFYLNDLPFGSQYPPRNTPPRCLRNSVFPDQNEMIQKQYSQIGYNGS